jgi:hypothetical protein
MSNPDQDADDSKSLISTRTMEIVMSLFFLGIAGLFMADSWRIGIGWLEGQGPASGLFPFYMSLFIALASLVNLQQVLTKGKAEGDESFVTRKSFLRVLFVLVPTLAFIFGIQYLGIYVSAAIFIFVFMLASREPVWRAGLISIGTAVALFFMFEKWFLVPLPKGPLEAMLGF